MVSSRDANLLITRFPQGDSLGCLAKPDRSFDAFSALSGWDFLSSDFWVYDGFVISSWSRFKALHDTNLLSINLDQEPNLIILTPLSQRHGQRPPKLKIKSQSANNL